MKKLIGLTLIGLMVLASGPAASAWARSGRRSCSPRSSRSYRRRDNYGAVAAGIIGAGLFIAAASHRPPPVYYAPAYYYPPPPVYYAPANYYPPPPPPPVYYRPARCVPVYCR